MVNDTTRYLRYAAFLGATWLDNFVGTKDMATEAIKRTPQWQMATNFWQQALPTTTAKPNSKEAILTTAAHELRTPLTSIRALSAILDDNPQLEVAQRKQYLEIIRQESEKLTNLVNDMLNLTELELDNVAWQVTDVDLGAVIDEAVAAVADRVASENIRLQVRLPETVPLISADYQRLVQVVTALLTNAINACDKQAGWVGLRVRQIGGFVQIEVSDNGPTVDSGLRPVLLDNNPYLPLPEAVTEVPKNTSLGLLMSRDIVAHFGGKLWTTPNLKHGAKFCFTLPVKLTYKLIDPWQCTRAYLLKFAIPDNEEAYAYQLS